MPIDPNIAMSFQTPQFESPLNSYAKVMAIQHAQNQNALAQYSLSQAQRNDQLNEGMLNYMRSPDYKPEGLVKFGTPGIAAYKGITEAGYKAKEAEKVSSEIADASLKRTREMLSSVSTPEEFMRWSLANHNDPVIGPLLKARGITPEASAMQIVTAMAQPGGFQQLLQQSALGLGKFIELNKPTLTSQNLGDTERLLATPGLGGPSTVVPGSEAKVGVTPSAVLASQTAIRGQDVSAGTAQRGQDLTYRAHKEALAQAADPTIQAAVAGARTTATETAKGDVATQTLRKHEKEGAQQVLKILNYDPATGSDDISKLIPESTSGVVERVMAAGKGAVTGTGTPGAEAIGKLGTMANKMALDIAGGKLGAGISNTDRDFIAASLGDVANPNLTANVRYEAWRAARGRLEQLAGGGGSKSISTAPALPPGFKRD
jgi:hypothetical protein